MSDYSHKIVAIMLAGGQGSRLYEITDEMCKPAVPFAGGRRIVDWTMANLAASAPSRVLIATQYRPDALVEHIDRFWRPTFAPGTLHVRHGTTVTGCDEGYAGTAGAVAHNMPEIMAMRPEHILVVAADHIYRMDYDRMIAAHRASGLPVTVAVDRVSIRRARGFGVLSVNPNGVVETFEEKPHNPKAMSEDPLRALVSMGIYVFDAKWLRSTLMEDQADPVSSHDFGHDVLPRAVRNHAVHAYDVAAFEPGFFWRDVGTLDALRETCVAISDRSVNCACPSYGSRTSPDATTRILGGGTVVLPGATVAPGARLRKTIVAPGARVPDEVVAGFDPRHDQQHFRVTPEGTVLITPQMLARRAASLRRIDLLRA